jgi:hypothetical protein
VNSDCKSLWVNLTKSVPESNCTSVDNVQMEIDFIFVASIDQENYFDPAKNTVDSGTTLSSANMRVVPSCATSGSIWRYLLKFVKPGLVEPRLKIPR